MKANASPFNALHALLLLLTVLLGGSAEAVTSARYAGQAAPARGVWGAEWLREGVSDRVLGYLRLRDGKLSFSVQSGSTGWELALTDVKKVAAVDKRSFSVESVSGEKYLMMAMEPNLMPMPPKKIVKALEEALKGARASQIVRD